MAVICVAALCGSQAAAQELSGPCANDTIQRVVAGQKRPEMPYRVVTKAGENLALLGQDSFSPMEWHSGDSIEICADAQGQGAFDIFNSRTGQTLVTMPDKNAAARLLKKASQP